MTQKNEEERLTKLVAHYEGLWELEKKRAEFVESRLREAEVFCDDCPRLRTIGSELEKIVRGDLGGKEAEK